MNRTEAIQVLEESFSRTCSTPDYSAEDREAFLDAEKNKLRELVIEPKVVVARPGDWARTHGEFPDENCEMYAVAGTGDRWLLYDPRRETFSLATGEPGGSLVRVGFASSDAMAVWLG